jgi:glycosyltransferase involved in cell wall biosynthesis
MKIVHISLVKISIDDPERWLDKIQFYTGIVTAMVRLSEVYSMHCIDYDGKREKEGATFLFYKRRGLANILPFMIYREIGRIKPDVLIVHSLRFPLQTFLLRMILGEKPKLFVQNHAEQFLPFPWSIAQQFADRGIDGYFFCSKQLGAPWVSKNQIGSMEKVHELMEVSTSFKRGDRIFARRKLKMTHRVTYSWVGRLDQNKDPETLVRAFVPFAMENSAVALHIIFQEDTLGLASRLKSLAATVSDQIHFVGFVEHHDMEIWFSASDFILSTSHYEGSGVAVCEAMACGCIPILTRIPSFQMMTNEGSVGLLFDAGDVSKLRNCLDKSLTIQLEKERDEVVRHFNEHLSFQAIAGKIHSIVSR